MPLVNLHQWLSLFKQFDLSSLLEKNIPWNENKEIYG